jgi:hypothetical protein
MASGRIWATRIESACATVRLRGYALIEAVQTRWRAECNEPMHRRENPSWSCAARCCGIDVHAPHGKLHESSTCSAVHVRCLRGEAITWRCRPADRRVRYREDARSAVGGGIARGRSLGVSWHELPRRRFSIAVSTWRPTDIWYSRRYCTRRGSSSARCWVSGCCVSQTASCAASPTATRKSSSSMLPRSRATHPVSVILHLRLGFRNYSHRHFAY